MMASPMYNRSLTKPLQADEHEGQPKPRAQFEHRVSSREQPKEDDKEGE